MTSAEMLTLERDGQRAVVAPGHGGALASYSAEIGGGRVDLLRETGAVTPDRSILDFASFPLVPYSSRIRDGRFSFGGRKVQLPLNFGDHPHSIHGHGWQRPWTVVDKGADAVTLAYRHAADHWPWAYEARQSIRLDGGGLALELAVVNRADSLMPVGLGFHPYFPRAGEARLSAKVAAVWRMDGEVMPVAREPLPADWKLGDGMALAGRDLDNCFDGWDRSARIEWPKTGVALDLAASEPFGNLVVYAPAGQGFFCVEPVSNITDAFNLAAAGHTATGMRTLEPSETLAGRMRLVPRAL
ncbi:MAG: aldose 1-epimerase [Alphaproteobacteria bacterium]